MVVLSNFLVPEEGVRHKEKQTTLYINNTEVGNGTLYITESVLSWIKNDTRQGFSLEYPNITLHAISRDQQVHPRQCLYVMVDVKVDLPGEVRTPERVSSEDDDDDDHDNHDSDSLMTEMRFAPENTNNLDAMFQAMSHCQSLHPDPDDSYSDETDGENHNGTEIEEAMDVESGQFEDAEETP